MTHRRLKANYSYIVREAQIYRDRLVLERCKKYETFVLRSIKSINFIVPACVCISQSAII